MRKLIVIAIAITAALAVLAPTAAPAQEPDLISSVTIVSAVIDTETGVPTVTFSVTCLMDVPYQVFGAATLTQSHGSGRLASSFQKGIGGVPCQAGQVLTFSKRFGLQQGIFVPGPAEIRGFIEADLVCCLEADLQLIGPTTVILRPA
jgi:hypothetical protein